MTRKISDNTLYNHNMSLIYACARIRVPIFLNTFNEINSCIKWDHESPYTKQITTPNTNENRAEKKHHIRDDVVMPSKRVISKPHIIPSAAVPRRENALPSHSSLRKKYMKVLSGPIRKKTTGNHPPSFAITRPVQNMQTMYMMAISKVINEYRIERKLMGRDVSPPSSILVLKIDINRDLFGENLLEYKCVRHSNLIQSISPMVIPANIVVYGNINTIEVV